MKLKLGLSIICAQFALSSLAGQVHGEISILPIADGFARDVNNDGIFDTLDTTDDLASCQDGFNDEERILIEFDIAALNDQVADGATLSLSVRTGSGSVNQPYMLLLFAYAADGVVTLSDATRSATFIAEAGPYGGVNDLTPSGDSFFDIDLVALQSVMAGSDFLGLRIQSVGLGGIAVETLESTALPAPAPPLLTLNGIDRVLFVDDDAPDGGDGASWATAYNDLQDAIDSAVGGFEIWVAEGTYVPRVEYTLGNPRTAHFRPKNRVLLFGGFVGNETQRRQRNPYRNRSVLSGDLNQDDSGPNFMDDNAYHVIYDNSGLNSDALIDGFEITRGNANGLSGTETVAGAIFMQDSAARFRNCRIKFNKGGSLSAGVYCDGTNFETLSFVNCIFEDHGGTAMRTSNEFAFIEIVNSVISDNDRGLVLRNFGSTNVSNSIVWGNGFLGLQDEQVDPLLGSVDFDYCCIEGLTGSLGGTGNIGVDPMFVNGPGGEYELLSGSPCRDAGNSELLPADVDDLDEDGDRAELLATDIEQDDRIGDDACVVDTGLAGAAAAVVDMGVIEFVPSTSPTTTVRVYVDANATGANNGTSWSDAYVELSEALAAIVENPCTSITEEVWVAQGVYNPTQDGDRYTSFVLANGVNLIGGFAGGEPSIEQRNHDPFSNNTLLSGEINGPDAEDNTGNVLIVEAGVGVNTIDGFTISGGHDDFGIGGGAGLRAIDANLVLRNLRITNNAAYSGGAAYIDGGTHEFVDITVDNNRSLPGFLNFGDAPGLYIYLVDGASFTRCDFLDNDATDPPGTSGGLRMRGSDTTVTMKDCQFLNNRSGLGGSLFSDFSTSMDIQNCRFINNSAVTFEPNTLSYGAGPTFLGGEIRLVNCEISGNRSRDLTAGIFANSADALDVINCTVFDNATVSESDFPDEETGAIQVAGGVLLTVRNTIVWGNTEIVNGEEVLAAPVADLGIQGASVLDVQYSCLQDEVPGDGNVFPGPGNIDSDPLLTTSDAARLMPGSPCIDAGDSLSIPVDVLDLDGDDDLSELISIDLDGNDRLVDVATVADTGNSNGVLVVVDMGAYEVVDDVGPMLLGDLNCDGLIDGRDIHPAILALIDITSYNTVYSTCNALNLDFDQNDVVQLADVPPFVDLLLGRPSGFNPGDMNCDGAVDGRDLGVFALAQLMPSQYALDFPDCPIANGDFNGNGEIDSDDIDDFVATLLAQ